MLSKRQETQRRRRQLHEELRSFAFAHVMRGSIVERRRRCGRANCACAQDPAARHPETYLSVHLQGRTVALSLRPEDEVRVQQAVDGYQRLWTIINELTACEVADLRREARERARGRRRRRG
jgi:hypothetical protein